MPYAVLVFSRMQMHGTVRELEANMEQLSLSQQYANRGIYILCKVVGDMMKGPAAGPGGRAASAAELENYIRHPPTIGGRIVPVRLLRSCSSDMPSLDVTILLMCPSK